MTVIHRLLLCQELSSRLLLDAEGPQLLEGDSLLPVKTLLFVATTAKSPFNSPERIDYFGGQLHSFHQVWKQMFSCQLWHLARGEVRYMLGHMHLFSSITPGQRSLWLLLLHFQPRTSQLASDGPGSVQQVTIPALTSILNPYMREDRALCPVRALQIFLEKSKQLRIRKATPFSILQTCLD